MLTRPITRPLTRPITRALVRRSSAFDPLTLFAQGQQGAWYDPSDLATLFQDAAGTIPVTGDGDFVGLMLDKSGNGNHASQSTTAAKPTYRTDGTLHWLEADGIDDFIGTGLVPFDGNRFFISTAFTYSGGQQYGGVFRFLSESGDPTSPSSSFLEEYSQTPAFTRKALFQRFPSLTIPYDDYSARPESGSPFVSWQKNTPTGFAQQVIGSQTDATTRSQFSLSSGNAMLDIFRGYSGAISRGRFFGQIWVSSDVPDDEILAANKYLAAKAGVTLP